MDIPIGDERNRMNNKLHLRTLLATLEEFGWNDWICMPTGETDGPYTFCIVVRERSEDEFEIFEDGVATSFAKSIQVVDVRSIIANAVAQVGSLGEDTAAASVLYYIENDAFVDLTTGYERKPD